jgi:hypothetical protein
MSSASNSCNSIEKVFPDQKKSGIDRQPNQPPLNYYEDCKIALVMQSNVNGFFPMRIARIGSTITVSLNQVTFTDTASPQSNTIGSVGVLPERFRPRTLIHFVISTFNGSTNQFGCVTIGPDGTVNYIVDRDITSGKTWCPSGNKIDGICFTYKFF